ncbi:NAD-binding protein [Patulibacter sp. NPDC049589]|uniref:NAD-binding protein n=1 Tax=Patulibacter sp. NPDC049589 TaxID=3154731 RepID=UPI0034421CB5
MTPQPPRDPAPSTPRGHVIVCGTDDVALRTVEQLRGIGVEVVVVDEHSPEATRTALDRLGVRWQQRGEDVAAALWAAGLEHARAVICTEDSDLHTLGTALLVRDLRPDVRVVVHLDNPAVGRALEDATGRGSVVDVAGLFAPTVVEGCLGRRGHELDFDGERFLAVETDPPRPGTLRELYGDLAPIGVERPDGELVVGPGRDVAVAPGDRVTLIGSRDELRAAGVIARVTAGDRAEVAARRVRARLGAVVRLAGRYTDGAVRRLLLAGAVLLLVLAAILHLVYRTELGGHPSFLEGVYFALETSATVGYGDFSFAAQRPSVQVLGIGMIAVGTTLVSLLFAMVTNVLVSRRIEQSLGRAAVRGVRGHVVIIGMGAVGMRVLEGLLEREVDVVVIERDPDHPELQEARRLGASVVNGDATHGRTLQAAALDDASAVAVLTSDDLTNIEAGLAVRDRLRTQGREDVPVVLRVADIALGARLQRTFRFRQVWSTATFAAPWFVGAALGLRVLSTFYVGGTPFLLTRIRIADDDAFAGREMRDLVSRSRVIALRHPEDPSVLERPRRGTSFRAGDEAYVVGPPDELLRFMRSQQRGAGGAEAG